MVIFCFDTIAFSDRIQLGLLIVGCVNILVVAVTAIILYRTLKEGQRQSEEGRKLTGYSLAINQYNILYQDLLGIIKKFEELNFTEIINKSNNPSLQKFNSGKEIANGMNLPMIYIFGQFLHPQNEDLTEKEVSNFRLFILFPLLREYVSLYDFLKEIRNDKILSVEYKSRFYKIIERDILQSYFRICNFSMFNHILKYNLSSLQETDLEDFYAINNFYIENNLFQYNNLKFYQEHH